MNYPKVNQQFIFYERYNWYFPDGKVIVYVCLQYAVCNECIFSEKMENSTEFQGLMLG